MSPKPRRGLGCKCRSDLLLTDAPRAVDIGIEPVSLAAGGVHQPAVSIDGAGSGRAWSGYDGPGERAFVAGEKSQGAEANRDFTCGSPAGGPVIRFVAGRNARRRNLSRISRRCIS